MGRTENAPFQTTETNTPHSSINYISCQESVLLALLNRYAVIVVKKPRKKGDKTEQFIGVHSITVDSIIDVSDFISTRCETLYNEDIKKQTKEYTASRRKLGNKITELTHLLIDLLELEGYFFNKEKKKREGLNQCDVIKNIFYDNKVIFTKDDIIKKGHEINKLITHDIENGLKVYNKGEIESSLMKESD